MTDGHDQPSDASQLVDCEANGQKQHWQVPREVPVAFIYNDLTFAVMLATPANLEDYALGFSLTEEIVRNPDELLSMDIRERPQGI